MTLAEVIDEHFLARYRALLDAEDAAFDELEHAYEEGDRANWDADISAWRSAIEARMAYLANHEIDLSSPKRSALAGQS
ncbi:MAG: hypothetical protein NVS3B12_19420 [Acidimicrobiales bacterium]